MHRFREHRPYMHQFTALMDISALINSSLDIAEVQERAIKAASEVTNSEAASLLLIDGQTGELYFDVALGERGESVKTIRIEKGQGIAGRVALTQRAEIVNDVQKDPGFYSESDEKSGFKTRNMICIPVKIKNRLIGVLQVMNKNNATYREDDLDTLTALSHQIAVAVDNARLYQELQEAFWATVRALAETVEKKDPYTGGHTRRVMDYSLAIGRIMGLTKDEMSDLRFAAALHDIGKIGIKDSVLLKHEKLTDEEFELIMQHPVFGEEILEHVKSFKNVLPGVKHHHEKYDGSGYPDQLHSGKIPVIARIIAVADTFDAMTTDRPYRQGESSRAALEKLEKMKGTQLDPHVVDAFFRSFAEKQ